MKRMLYIGLLVIGMFAQLARAQLAYTGRHSVGGASTFSAELTADGSAVRQIIVTDIECGTDFPFGRHTFTLAFNPNLPVVASRFSAKAIPLTISNHAHTLDIDGILFDADSDGAKEQALGGLSFVSGANRCHFRWWATTVAVDTDADGWSDAAERRLGSIPTTANSTPEHREVPTTSIYGPGPYRDYEDNDRDQFIDEAERDGPDADAIPDCAPPLPLPQPSPTDYTGRHSASTDRGSFSLKFSSDGAALVQINAYNLECGSDFPFGRHSFTLELNPVVPVIAGRFSSRNIPVTITPDPGHTHTLDIDGVVFDADADGTKEQALGGLSFVSGTNRCNFRWWVTAIATDSDGDGWGDTAERRFGAIPTTASSTPEHRAVPTTPIFGPGVCSDFEDNDRDGKIDTADGDGPDTDPCPDCSSNLSAPSVLRVIGISPTQIDLKWVDNSDDETGFEIERKTDNGVFNRIVTVAANETTYADADLAPNTAHAYRIRAVNANSSSCTYSNYTGESITIVTSVKENITQTPSSFALEQNYPNPFNPSTTIAFSLPRAERVMLKVFDLLGKEIVTLVDEKLTAGHYEVRWKAGDVESGTYFYQLRAGKFVATKKLVLMQ